MDQDTDGIIRSLLAIVKRDMCSYEASPNPEVLDHLVLQLDILHSHLVVIGLDNCVLKDVVSAVEALTALQEELSIMCSQTPCPNTRGRHRLDIQEEQLVHLLSLKFTCPAIATMLGVSLRTVRRRMTEYGLCVHDFYSTISNPDLDHAVSALKQQYPNSGYRMMAGLLLQLGVRVTQTQLRECMHRVDPNGVVLRWKECVQRRQYSVPHPLALWHIDGNHKLIR